MTEDTHQAGFVHLIGKPNAGKSTLFNALVKKNLSVVTHKPQTTRQELIGMVNAPHHQIIYVDTPGYIQAKTPLQKAMVKSIQRSIPGADILLWVIDARDKEVEETVFQHFATTIPTFLVLNKIDLLPASTAGARIEAWRQQASFTEVLPLSARYGTHLDTLTEAIEKALPIHPAFYAKDEVSDRPVRFFAEEIIRKVIFLQYYKEIPYSTAVLVTSYQEEEAIIRLEATIYTERLSQKKILIGKNGVALQRLCIAVRKALTSFLGKSIFFKPYVKTLANWRKKPHILQKWGYF